jgi:hypothetical protein
VPGPTLALRGAAAAGHIIVKVFRLQVSAYSILRREAATVHWEVSGHNLGGPERRVIFYAESIAQPREIREKLVDIFRILVGPGRGSTE